MINESGFSTYFCGVDSWTLSKYLIAIPATAIWHILLKTHNRKHNHKLDYTVVVLTAESLAGPMIKRILTKIPLLKVRIV